MRLHKTEKGFICIPEVGAPVLYDTVFFEHGANVMRIDTNPDGKEVASIIRPRMKATIDSASGEVLIEQRGFSPADELIGLGDHPETGKEYVLIKDSDIPAGYNHKTHKYDKGLGRLVLK